MVWSKANFVENVTDFTAAVGNNIEEGISEAKAAVAAAFLRVTQITQTGGTSQVTGYIGPLVGMAVSKEGLEEPGFLERLEQFSDGWTPEVALKPETWAAGATNPGKVNISNFLTIWKKIGTKKVVRGHCLAWWQGLAQWMYLPSEEINGKKGTWTGTEAEYREQYLAITRQVVEAVGQRTKTWDVLNELTNSGKLRQCVYTEIFGKSLTIVKTNPVMQFYAELLKVVKEANPSCSACVNEYEIETTFNYEAGQRGTVFLEFVNVLLELEASNSAKYAGPDMVGMQCHTNTGRSLGTQEAAIQAIVPKYTEKELEVEFTELDIQIEPSGTEAQQEQLYEEFFNGGKKSGVGRITIWGVTRNRSWLNAIWEVPYKLTSTTAIGATVLNITGAESKKLVNGMAVKFAALPAGVTTLNTTTVYFVVGAGANACEVSLTEGGAAIKVEGHALEAANTEIKKFAGLSGGKEYGPKALPFSWEGEVLLGWRAVERTRPEQPGVGPWKPLSLNVKAKAKSVVQTPMARYVGLSVEFAGQVEATEELAGSATVFTIPAVPAGMRPTVERQVPWVVNGASTFLTFGINGAVSIQSTDKLPVTKVLRLDGLRVPVS